mmetsp:Transcript_62/g.167  ORF Transcript_62/g.167 Transcript_62/m.167 type:complete len:227 (+) Transcript_62:876-1556(+)
MVGIGLAVLVGGLASSLVRGNVLSGHGYSLATGGWTGTLRSGVSPDNRAVEFLLVVIPLQGLIPLDHNVDVLVDMIPHAATTLPPLDLLRKARSFLLHLRCDLCAVQLGGVQSLIPGALVAEKLLVDGKLVPPCVLPMIFNLHLERLPRLGPKQEVAALQLPLHATLKITSGDVGVSDKAAFSKRPLTAKRDLLGNKGVDLCCRDVQHVLGLCLVFGTIWVDFRGL